MDSILRVTLRQPRTMLLTVLWAVLALSSGAAATPAAKQVLRPFKEARFLLPEGAKVETRWVLPPTDQDRSDALFSVDASGDPLIKYGSSTLLDPGKKFLVTVDAPISGITHLANGVLLLASGNRLGLLAKPERQSVDKKGRPIVAFQPIAALPLKRINVLAAGGDTAYCAGPELQTGRYALFILRSVKGAGFKDLDLIYRSETPITAATGNDKAVYVAVGSKVVRISRKDGSEATVYTHPSADVNALVLTPAGLMVSTGTDLMVLAPGGALEILHSTGHRIAISGSTLYVLFRNSLGVLALDNLGDLNRFNLGVRPVAAGERKPPLAVTSVRFYEADPPAFGRQPFAESFDRTKVHRIVAQIDYQGTPAAGGGRHTLTVSWYEPSGGRLLTVSYPVDSKSAAATGRLLAFIGAEPPIQGKQPGYHPTWSLFNYGD
ncbi:MAG TPA: hypothetical protein VJ955_02325, partial [Desulfuromonadales bacterium]|nr:hypothetical protein [Desulfuromonadales bacterium]